MIISKPPNKVYDEQWERIYNRKQPLESPMSQKYLNECFLYSPDSGILTWRDRPLCHFKRESDFIVWNKRFSGKVAGSILKNKCKQYRNICLGNRIYLAHRAIWIMVHGEDADNIDHINGDGLDNRLHNLRSVSMAENAKNVKLLSTNTSGVCGVGWNKVSGRWTSEAYSDGKRYFLGSFDNIVDAVAARFRVNNVLGFHENHGKTR